jgi:hypothetical protein
MGTLPSCSPCVPSPRWSGSHWDVAEIRFSTHAPYLVPFIALPPRSDDGDGRNLDEVLVPSRRAARTPHPARRAWWVHRPATPADRYRNRRSRRRVQRRSPAVLSCVTVPSTIGLQPLPGDFKTQFVQPAERAQVRGSAGARLSAGRGRRECMSPRMTNQPRRVVAPRKVSSGFGTGQPLPRPPEPGVSRDSRAHCVSVAPLKGAPGGAGRLLAVVHGDDGRVVQDADADTGISGIAVVGWSAR